jgi:molybdate transport system substrate-binding protein
MKLKILSGGAVQGLVHALAPRFEAETGCGIDGTFGAVGAMREKLVGSAPADLVLLTAALVAELSVSGHVVPGSARDIGIVHTAVAVRESDPSPPVGDGPALRDAMLAADAIYAPDLRLSTAGIHFAKVLDTLGIRAKVEPRLRVFPNGATAMRELAAAGGHPIGCTQVTEILNTPGVALVAPLPKGLELATVYTAGICTKAAEPELARRLIELLTGASQEQTRFGFSAVKPQ